MKADLFIWRPIVAKLLRYSDLEKMSVGDLLDAHEVLDIQEHMKEKEIYRDRKSNRPLDDSDVSVLPTPPARGWKYKIGHCQAIGWFVPPFLCH